MRAAIWRLVQSGSESGQKKEEGRVSICSLQSTGAVKIMVHGRFHVPKTTSWLMSSSLEDIMKPSIKMSILELKNLSNEDLKKRLASQIHIEDWPDECGK